MKARFAHPFSWSPALAIVLSALCVFAGDVSVRLVSVANPSQAPALPGDSSSPCCPVGAQETMHVVRAGDMLLIPITSLSFPATAPDDTPDAVPLPPFESPLPPPVPEEDLSSPTAPAPPLSTDEESVHDLAVLEEGQKALAAALKQQGTHIAGLVASTLHHDWHLEELWRALAMLKNDQLRLTNTIAAIHNDTKQRQAHPSVAQPAALAAGVALAFTVLGIVIVRVVARRPPAPLPLRKTLRHGTKPVATVPAGAGESALPEIHMSLHYLSTPKHEDRIASASCPGLYVLGVADGASSYRCQGIERSGGGGEAAAIAVKVAITHLTDHLHPGLGLSELLAHLTDCFAKAQSALEYHNADASIPGATTLVIAALWQAASGGWYWLYGNIGDGVLTLLHTGQLLSGWPVSTPLSSTWII